MAADVDARAPLTPATLAVAAGMAAGLARPVPAWGGPLLMPAAAAGGLLALALCLGWGGLHREKRRHRGILGLLLCAGFLLGAVTRIGADRSCIHWLPTEHSVQVAGTIEAAAPGGQVRLRLDSVWVGATPIACDATVPARWRRGGPSSAPVGASVAGVGRWWSPPGGGGGLLRRPGALLLDSADVTGGAARPPLAERFGRAGRTRVDRLFGAQAPLAASLLLAQRDALDGVVRDRFARAGLSHLLAISGLHVGLICGILFLIGSLLRLGKRWAAVLAAAGTIGYVLLLGAPHSAVRAALQLVLLLAATMLQRPTRPEALVATAALLLLVRDPGALLSPGFQLSFAGVIGLLAIRPPILALARGSDGGGWAARGKRWLADALATSIAATLATAPIVAWHFGQVAPIGVVANLIAIPLLSLILPALAVALIGGLLSPALGVFLASPGVLGLAALERVATLAAAAPGAAVPLHGATALLLTTAIAAGYIASRRLGQVRPVIRRAAWAAVAAMVVVAAPLRPVRDGLEIHVIDVGQGDAVAVRSPAGRWILVDAGVAGRGFDAGGRRVVPYLAARGVRRLEGLVLTHAHADHMGGAATTLQSLRPRWVGDPGSPSPSAHYLGLLRVAVRENARWVGLRQGASIVLDGVAVDFLHPEVIGALEDDPNDLSVVMRIAYGEFAALLTGDATALVEERMIRSYGAELQADVLKVGHHGSATSTTPAFLDAVRPAIAVVSAGRGNRYGHPHAVVVDRLEASGVRVLRTDRHGSVVIRADARGSVRIDHERGGP